jgi:hypothetical protein
MMAYASRTGTRRTLASLRAANWGLMVSATGALRTEGFPRWCLDNGAWTAYQQGRPFNANAFLVAYEKIAPGADFCVLPDIVAGGMRSLDYSLKWQERLDPVCPLLLAVQDGMTPADVEPLIGDRLGIFVGGTTRFKEDTLPSWGALARKRSVYLHVGRVNSARRVALCAMAGVDSIDGTSVTRFAQTLPLMDNAIRQGALPCM